MQHFRGKEIYAPDPEGFRRKIIDEGEGPIRSYAYSPPRNGGLPYHCHADSTEIHLIIEGEGTMVVDGKEFPFAAPDILLVEPGEYHLMPGGPEPIHLLAVVSPNQDDLVWPSQSVIDSDKSGLAARIPRS